MNLGIDDDELAACVACGLCLPHCPTYRVTGEEARSPRGRITAMRQVQWEGLSPDRSFVDAMATCVQCRGCETACPAGVPFGRLMEDTRTTVTVVPRWQRLGLAVLGHHRLLLAGSTALALAQRARLLPRRATTRLGLPARLPVRRPRLEGCASAADATAWLYPGCVMDAWQRGVHAAALRVMAATGARVALPTAPVGGGCCGALHVHAGLAEPARRLAVKVMRSMPGDAPVVVDSAGCGAAMADYGHLVGTEEARAFAARVIDVSAWLATRIELLPQAPPLDDLVAVHDACHLRHVQRAHHHVRTVLGRYMPLVELDDEGLCCGAGGAFAVAQPGLAAAVRDRKLAAIARSGARVVASANPGCTLYLAPALAAAGVTIRHPVELVDRALGGGR